MLTRVLWIGIGRNLHPGYDGVKISHDTTSTPILSGHWPLRVVTVLTHSPAFTTFPTRKPWPDSSKNISLAFTTILTFINSLGDAKVEERYTLYPEGCGAPQTFLWILLVKYPNVLLGYSGI